MLLMMMIILFLAQVMEIPTLYVMDDPLAAVNVMTYYEGEGLNWHFDRSEFTTTLLLQAPEKGSVFEYRPGLRSESDANVEGVANLLAGNDEQVRQTVMAARTLNVFKGKNTAHRVTPVLGSIPRVVSVFSFFESPGVTFSEKERLGFYGRKV